jgi:hypothetical protein
MFYIGFVAAPRIDLDGRRRAAGEITLGDDSPHFDSDLSDWRATDYLAQWKEGIARLAGGERSSALVTSYGGASAREHEMWPMWREGSEALLQRQRVSGELITSATSGEPFYSLVDQRPILGDEWRMPLGQLLAFIADE